LPLAAHTVHALTMFVVTEAQAATIRATYEQRGEILGCGRATPAVSWHYGQRAGAGMRAQDRELAAAA